MINHRTGHVMKTLSRALVAAALFTAGCSLANAKAPAGTKDVDETGGFRIHSGNAMFGVDYPHFESIFPDTMEHVATLVGNPHVTEDDARKILYENAAEVYAFDLAALQPTIDEWGFELDDLVPAPA